MGDLINKQDALDILDEYNSHNEIGWPDYYGQARRRMCNLPSIEPERKTGRWIGMQDERFVMCSECGMETTRNELAGISLFGKDEPNYCPNCGADMRGEQYETD